MTAYAFDGADATGVREHDDLRVMRWSFAYRVSFLCRGRAIHAHLVHDGFHLFRGDLLAFFEGFVEQLYDDFFEGVFVCDGACFRRDFHIEYLELRIYRYDGAVFLRFDMNILQLFFDAAGVALQFIGIVCFFEKSHGIFGENG